MSTIKVTQVRSRNGANKQQLAALRTLGLNKIGQTVQREDSPQLRGNIDQVSHLVRVEGAK